MLIFICALTVWNAIVSLWLLAQFRDEQWVYISKDLAKIQITIPGDPHYEFLVSEIVGLQRQVEALKKVAADDQAAREALDEKA